MHPFSRSSLTTLAGAALLALNLTACGGDGPVGSEAVSVPTLIGFASLPADSYVEGPSSGQYISGADYASATGTHGYTLPFVNKQPMQGFSALAQGPVPGCFYLMQDNGFGSKPASPNALLHVYAVKPDWVTGKVAPAQFTTCDNAAAFDTTAFMRLRDPDRKLGFAIVADGANYPGITNGGATLPVDPSIKSGRLLTGGDLDLESMVVDADGNFWFGDEFGPYLVKTDRSGKVLARAVPLPNTLKLGGNPLVQSPSNPELGTATPNLPNSGGFESMTIDPARKRIYTLLEKDLVTDTDPQRRILNVFDIAANAYLPVAYSYRVGSGSYVNAAGATVREIFSVNDITAINDHEFLVVEKDRGAGDARAGFPASGADRVAARVKKVYRIDLNKVGADGYLVKEEVVDLMKIADPRKLAGSATIDGIFTFPMECVEAVRIVDRFTLMLVNDNNYPGGSGSRKRNRPDDNEFILVRLPVPLNL
ncbi:esterase-like activity of phytase family protein [Pseudoduganella buxea]|uniref:Glycosyl transferase family 1 n=1 Tax=Pseudoduganella buxea TaxID=1949069 RepID=A0A6I3STN9_9BURK|nr:esterase-like activity of phytase family protein [Pseudoduganella buxea]MTV52508.1 PEP-CTERM sorting domain-containing protein [Pseudoduganella buxea]GGB88575.1 glycosyl transferase family 1 [Pseudoduganella buxea]